MRLHVPCLLHSLLQKPSSEPPREGHSQPIWRSVALSRFLVLNLLPLLQYAGLLPLLLEGHRPWMVKAPLRQAGASGGAAGGVESGQSPCDQCVNHARPRPGRAAARGERG